jgi:hypothetical protein
MDEPYYPWEALIPIRDARYDAAATYGIEMLSGTFIWSDENYLEFVAICRSRGNDRYWEPVVYRSSLIRGQPHEAYRRGWEELRRFVPQWPGFRAERCSESLKAALEQAIAAQQ